MDKKLIIWAIGGESHSAPENTIPAYWSAIGAGANGIALGLQLSKDGIVVCSQQENLDLTCDHPDSISNLTYDSIRAFDAGKMFTSTVLDTENQVKSKGEETPWSGDGKHPSQWLYHKTLEEVFLHFSRRTQFLLLLDSKQKTDDRFVQLVEKTAKIVKSYGLERTISIATTTEKIKIIKSNFPEAKLLVSNDEGDTLKSIINKAVESEVKSLLIDDQLLISLLESSGNWLKTIEENGITFQVAASIMPFALTPDLLRGVERLSFIQGVLCRSVHRTLDGWKRRCMIFQDSFEGQKVNQSNWVTGYSKNNKDSKIYQDDSLIIDINHGGAYSGAAAITNFTIHKDFDAQVAFEVKNPHQGTTFELAAINVDAGYRKTNLTFDVHGVPPYASSERDEDDGFRIGWNNGPALTNFVPTKLLLENEGKEYQVERAYTEAQSSNLYNNYSRDVGYAKKDRISGELRLVRTGSIFNAYYKDSGNQDWVLCGSALVSTLSEDIFLRLGAKHWPKGGITPPSNTIVFKDFKIFQRSL